MHTNGIDIQEFELEVELKDGSKEEYGYKNSTGKAQGSVKLRDASGNHLNQEGDEAIRTIEKLLAELAPSKQMSPDALLKQARSVLHMSEDRIAHLEVEVEFADGSEIEANS